MKKKITKPDDQLEKQISDYFELAEGGTEQKHDSPNEVVFESERIYTGVLRRIKIRNFRSSITLATKIAASVILFIAVSTAIYYFRSQGDTRNIRPVLVTQTAAHGRIIKVILMDGTSVMLNSGSELVYPSSFASNSRTITLRGEAYFDVAQDPKRPFIIESGNVKTQVLGTSFHISAYPEMDNIKVAVLTGKVAVSVHDSESSNDTRYITENQQVTYNKTKDLLSQTERTINTNESVAWWKQSMNYKNSQLSEVIADVSRKYGVDITISESLKGCRITADLEDASLEKVLKVLTSLVDGNMQYKKGAYILSGKGC